MKQFYVVMSLIILAFTSNSLFAQEMPSTSPSASTDNHGKNIQGTNASGNQQTTIIDESGNLKVVDGNTAPTASSNSPGPDATSVPPTSPMPAPNMTSPPIDSNLNAEQHIVRDATTHSSPQPGGQ